MGRNEECLTLNVMIMATPIKETPILTGEDARRFLKRMNEKREIPQEEIERMKRNYELIMSIAEFD